MAEHDRTPVYYAVMMARGEHDECVGYQAFRMVRETGERTFVGPVRATYVEGRQDAWDAYDAEFGVRAA